MDLVRQLVQGARTKTSLVVDIRDQRSVVGAQHTTDFNKSEVIIGKFFPTLFPEVHHQYTFWNFPCLVLFRSLFLY